VRVVKEKKKSRRYYAATRGEGEVGKGEILPKNDGVDGKDCTQRLRLSKSSLIFREEKG